MKTKSLTIPITATETTSAVLCETDSPAGPHRTGILFAHGAANDMHHPLIVSLAENLAAKGFITLRFNFIYREKGGKSPDSQATLVKTWQGVYRFFQTEVSVDRTVVVGKSMGGRVASQMVADGSLGPDRLVFLGYPLHAPGRLEVLRDAHLYAIKVPMLFFAGTRDTLCDLSRLQRVLTKLECPHDLEVIDGGDHSFKLPDGASRTARDVHRQVLDKILSWI